jgi:hypothetical protein
MWTRLAAAALLAACGCTTTRLEVVRDADAELWTSLQERSFRDGTDFSWRPRHSIGNFASIREVISPTEPFDFVAGDALLLCFRRSGDVPEEGAGRTAQSVLVIAVPKSAATAGASLDAASLHVGWFDESAEPGGFVRVGDRATGSVKLDAVDSERVAGSLDLGIEAVSSGRRGSEAQRVRVRGEFEAARRAR